MCVCSLCALPVCPAEVEAVVVDAVKHDYLQVRNGGILALCSAYLCARSQVVDEKLCRCLVLCAFLLKVKTSAGA